MHGNTLYMYTLNIYTLDMYLPITGFFIIIGSVNGPLLAINDCVSILLLIKCLSFMNKTTKSEVNLF